MFIRNFLEYRTFDYDPEEEYNPWVFVETDPLYQFAHVVGDDGNPFRCQSIVSVKVPMHPWLEAEENDIIFRTMVEASKSNVRRVQSFQAMDRAFWAKCSKNLHALILHPDNEGKLMAPPRTPTFYTEEVPKNRLVGVGPQHLAGIYLVRGPERGFVAKRQQGLLGILINQP